MQKKKLLVDFKSYVIAVLLSPDEDMKLGQNKINAAISFINNNEDQKLVHCFSLLDRYPSLMEQSEYRYQSFLRAPAAQYIHGCPVFNKENIDHGFITMDGSLTKETYKRMGECIRHKGYRLGDNCAFILVMDQTKWQIKKPWDSHTPDITKTIHALSQIGFARDIKTATIY